jgi:hypothetical protein
LRGALPETVNWQNAQAGKYHLVKHDPDRLDSADLDKQYQIRGLNTAAISTGRRHWEGRPVGKLMLHVHRPSEVQSARTKPSFTPPLQLRTTEVHEETVVQERRSA